MIKFPLLLSFGLSRKSFFCANYVHEKCNLDLVNNKYCSKNLSQMYYIFPKEKKRKKKAILLEVMTYENGRKHD